MTHTKIIKRTIYSALVAVSFLQCNADILRPSGTATTNFGLNVGLEGNIVVTVDHNANVSPNAGVGVVYVYSYDAASDSWSQQLLKSDTPIAKEQLGYGGLSISGNRIMAGSSKNSAYIFEYDSQTQTWGQTQLLPSGVNSDNFAKGVAIEGDIAVLTQASDDMRNTPNYLYLYNYDSESKSWIESKITSSLEGYQYTNGSYGQAGTKISGNMVVVGADRYTSPDDRINYAGAVCVYMYDNETKTWNETILRASDPEESGRYGWSSAVDGNTVVVGSTGLYGAQREGKVYVHEYDSQTDAWNERKIERTGDLADESFGHAIAIDGNNILISATNIETVFLYDKETFGEVLKIQSSTWSDRYFGTSIDLDGDAFVISGLSSQLMIHTGTISSMTTVDDSTSQRIVGHGFTSKIDWVVGENNSGNKVALGAGDTANVTADGKAVYIGKNSGSNSNEMAISGILQANKIYIGSENGNRDNVLRFMNTADWSGVEEIYLTHDNGLAFELDWDGDIAKLFDYLDETKLYAYDNGLSDWVLMDESNYLDYLIFKRTDLDGMLVILGQVPEPAAYAAIMGMIFLAFSAYRRKH